MRLHRTWEVRMVAECAGLKIVSGLKVLMIAKRAWSSKAVLPLCLSLAG